MAHSNTAFDDAQIHQYAGRHDSMALDIRNQLNQVQAQVEATLANSGSDMTKALSSVYAGWLDNVEKIVLTRLQAMSAAMKTEATNQDTQDVTNAGQMNQTGSPVGSYLNGG